MPGISSSSPLSQNSPYSLTNPAQPLSPINPLGPVGQLGREAATLPLADYPRTLSGRPETFIQVLMPLAVMIVILLVLALEKRRF